MKTISISLYNRPEYTKKMFESLKKCSGINEYIIFVSIDPGSEEVVNIAKNFSPDVLIVNKNRLGCNTNIFQSLSLAFTAGSKYNIHVEDDVLLSPDCIQYFNWCQQYENDNSIFSISAYNRTTKESPPHLISRIQSFRCWGWATWSSRWKEMKPRWDHDNRYLGWDNNINNRIRNSRYEIYPLLSRSQNIGALNGVHVRSAAWHAQNHHTPIWNTSYMIKEFEMLKR